MVHSGMLWGLRVADSLSQLLAVFSDAWPNPRDFMFVKDHEYFSLSDLFLFSVGFSMCSFLIPGLLMCKGY